MPKNENQSTELELKFILTNSQINDEELVLLESLLDLKKYNYEFWRQILLLSKKIYIREYGVERSHPKHINFLKRKIVITGYPLSKKLNIVSVYSLKKSSEFFAENLTAYALYRLYDARKRTLPKRKQAEFWRYAVNGLKTRGHLGEINIENLAPESFKYFDNLLELSDRVRWVYGSSKMKYGWDTGHGGYWITQ